MQPISSNFYQNSKWTHDNENDNYRGNQIHEALPITSGERWNLILWTRSSKMRKEKCPMCQSTPDLVPAPIGTYGDGFLWPGGEEENSQTTCSVF